MQGDLLSPWDPSRSYLHWAKASARAWQAENNIAWTELQVADGKSLVGPSTAQLKEAVQLRIAESDLRADARAATPYLSAGVPDGDPDPAPALQMGQELPATHALQVVIGKLAGVEERMARLDVVMQMRVDGELALGMLPELLATMQAYRGALLAHRESLIRRVGGTGAQAGTNPA